MKFKSRLTIFLIYTGLLIASAYALPTVYLFLGSGPAERYQDYLDHPAIKGAQIIYPWRMLEPEQDHYNLEPIEHDLTILASQHKGLFIQIQDKSFAPNIINVPDYLLSKEYEGGIAKQTDFAGEGKALTTGWVTKLWIPRVQERFQKLLITLGKHFDGRIAGINLTETAIDLDAKHLPPSFTCDRYFQAIIDNMHTLHLAFHQSAVVQYVNFFPCEWNNDHHYMQRVFDYAVKYHIGLGNPDGVPYRQGQMKNSYPFFHAYRKKLPLIAIAIQEPDYTYRNPETGKPFTVQTLFDFAENYLGATILFWNIQQPQFLEQFIPFVEKKYSYSILKP